MKASFTVLFSFFFLLSFSQKGTTELSLNGEWKFKTDPNLRGESLKWFNAEIKDNEWDSMNVPGNWDLKNEYAHYAGKAWYRKNITITADWKDKLVALMFEAVSGECKVWLNGKYLGSNNISYLSFQFIISSLLNFNSPNTLVVSVNNTSRQGAPWNWGGIRRPVTLVASNRSSSPEYIFLLMLI
jgi:beta-galactosidase